MLDVEITISAQWWKALQCSWFLFADQCASASASASGWRCVRQKRGGSGQKRCQSETQDHLQLCKFKNICLCPFLMRLLIKNKSGAWDRAERDYKGFCRNAGLTLAWAIWPCRKSYYSCTYTLTRKATDKTGGKLSVALFWCCCQLAVRLLNMSIGIFSLFKWQRQLLVNQWS